MSLKATRRTVSAERRSAAPARRGAQELEQFESLVDELSAAMAHTPAQAVDEEIGAWQGKICLALDLDRSAIYERDAPGKEVLTTHTWVRGNFPGFPRRHYPERVAKKTTDWIMAGNRIVFARPSEIPLEFNDTRRFVERYGPKASAILPMWAGDRVIGAASFGRFRSSREWNAQLVRQLEVAVRIFGSAIERKQTEATMRAAHAELVLVQRRSMMGELVASLAHEINQPLGAILSNLGGLARLLEKGNAQSELASQAVANAIEDTKRAGQIVRRVRALFKGDTSRRAVIDVVELAREVVSLIGSEAVLRKISVQITEAPPSALTFGDRVLLQQCLLNLLMNAFDAANDVEYDRRQVFLGVAEEKPGWISVTVRDRGTGIHPSVAGRVFEPFVSTKSGGMGLGLLVTRSVVENHGGRIWSESANGETSFTFTVPAAPAKRSGRTGIRTGRETRAM
jgi:signal transduction histidine kinase